MNNLMCLVGRLVKDIEENESGFIGTLAVHRNHKNEEGVYETDFIPVYFLIGIAITAREYCKKGDLIGIKGRLETIEDRIVVIAEKVTFLSGK